MRSAWTVAGAAGIAGLALGFGGGVLLGPRGEERLPPRDVAAAGGTADRAGEWLARLDAIDARLERLATLAVPAAAPSRVAAEPITPGILERLAAIEAALGRLASTTVAPAKGRDDPPRAARDATLFDRLFEAEYAKRQVRRDDHLGYTADRLYDRYGAPDYIYADPNDTSKRVTWAYKDSNGARGVNFWLQNGLVVDEGAWSK